MNIGIFGGTFDPIHEGHLMLARSARKHFRLDKVLFIPAFIPPHKIEKNDGASAEDRYRMLELALRGEKGFELSDIELARKGVSYTVDSLRILKKKYPNEPFFLILGMDNFVQLSTWYEPEEVRKLVIFLVAGRPGFARPEPGSGEVRWIPMPETDISASDIRRRISEGERIPSSILPEAVEDYIHRMRLYGWGKP